MRILQVEVEGIPLPALPSVGLGGALKRGQQQLWGPAGCAAAAAALWSPLVVGLRVHCSTGRQGVCVCVWERVVVSAGCWGTGPETGVTGATLELLHHRRLPGQQRLELEDREKHTLIHSHS